MRSLIILSIALVCVFAANTSLFDNTPDKVLESEEARKILKCLLNEGPCSKLASVLKQLVDENFPQECANCSPLTKHKLGKLFNYIRTNYLEDFLKYMDIIDPDMKKRDFAYKFLDDHQ